MRFLIDADLPRAAGTVIQAYQHEPVDVHDTGMRYAPDPLIAEYARQHALCLISGDFGFADIRAYPPADYSGLVVLEVPPHAAAPFILRMVESLLRQPQIVSNLPGRLTIVEPGRIRLRPSP